PDRIRHLDPGSGQRRIAPPPPPSVETSLLVRGLWLELHTHTLHGIPQRLRDSREFPCDSPMEQSTRRAPGPHRPPAPGRTPEGGTDERGDGGPAQPGRAAARHAPRLPAPRARPAGNRTDHALPAGIGAGHELPRVAD